MVINRRVQALTISAVLVTGAGAMLAGKSIAERNAHNTEQSTRYFFAQVLDNSAGELRTIVKEKRDATYLLVSMH